MGLAAPMTASGDMAMTCAAMVMIAPALPAIAPFGVMYMTTGTVLARIAWMISTVVPRSPPGVLSSITRACASCCSAFLMPRLMYSSMTGMIGPSAFNTSTRGALLCAWTEEKKARAMSPSRMTRICLIMKDYTLHGHFVAPKCINRSISHSVTG